MNSKAVFVLVWQISVSCLVCADDTCSGGKRTTEKCTGDTITVPDSIIEKLFELVLESQTQHDVLHFFDQTKINSKGSYKNVIKIHRVGDSFQTGLRRAVNINDLNSFVPMLITITLLDAYHYGRAPRPADQQLTSTLDFCNGFRDVNKPYNNSLMAFWPYFFDEHHQHYFPRPLAYTELVNTANLLSSNNQFNFKTKEKANLAIVMQIINQVSGTLTGVSHLNDLFVNILQQLEILDKSADADDTFVWLGLGSTLEMSAREFPKVRDIWTKHNPNIHSVFPALKKYAYRPFSHDPLVNTIDPTSYYVLREYLDDANTTGRDVAIVTTWLTNAAEALDRGGLNHKMINDIDATVCANVINGITLSILSGLVNFEILQDPDLAQIYQNTSSMLVFLINSNFSNRPDLALPYYPSRYQFYWSVARTVSIMETFKQNRDFPLPIMELVFTNMKHAMEEKVTRFVMSNTKRIDDGSIYFDDFLGNGDVTDDNKPITRGEDRIFTTAMAANVLMYTWLSFNSNSSKSSWKKNTPKLVKETVDGCIIWLVNNALRGKPWNVLFSTQNKGRDNLPFRYPANLFIEKPQLYPFQYVTSLQMIVGVRGYITKREYETLINTNHFGKPTPIIFKGYNHPDFSDMVFWSSDAYTYSVTLLALSRYREIYII